MKMIDKRLPLALAGLLAGLGPLGSAQAADAWEVAVTPYLWASGMRGDTQAGRLPKSSVDMKFSDIMDTLDFGLMGQLEARKNRWGVFVDAIYMKLSDSAEASPAVLGGSPDLHAKAQIRQSTLAVALTYRALEGESPVDLFGGIRYTKLDVDAELDARVFGGTVGLQVQRDASKDWFDPYIGVRAQHRLNDKWTLVGYGDVGGLGVGSDFTWQASLGANYDLSKTTSASFGYRYFSVDYDDEGFLYDMENQGLYMGVTFRF
jgi:opacity protein-like surface antigen